MEDVHEVKQLDNVHLHWRASVGGKEKEWNAQITEQVPDEVIAWRSLSGVHNAGQVVFEPLGPNRTRLTLTMEYEPETAAEKVGDWLGIFSRKVDKTVDDFKALIEARGRETGGWRGEVHGARTAHESSGALTGSGPGGSALSEERRRRVAEAAYYRAERRNFAPGKEEEDWLDAERDMDDLKKSR
jgi:hypothetical protein